MSHLELRFLGPPKVTLNGSAVTFETRKAVALLAYLAVTGGARRRDSLVNLLWPDLGQTRGRNVLRQVLYQLNKKLSKDRWLEVSTETVELRADPDLWVDVRQFQSDLAECREHCQEFSGACPSCFEVLQRALALYTDNFLSGFSLKDSVNFDDWQLVQTENLRLELNFLLDRLVRSFSEAGAHQQAIEHGRQWVALDRLNEVAHRWLMRSYLWSGQRPAALRQYQECEHVLQQEVDASPVDATRELFEAMKADQALPAEPSRDELPGGLETKSPPLGPSRDKPVKLPVPPTELIGRGEQLAAVAALLSEHRLVTLVGPGGSGKTHLSIKAAADQVDQFSDGLFFVPLETVRNPSKVPQAVASALDIPEVPGEEFTETIGRRLGAKEVLVVLDNFEQVAEASSFVSRVLEATTGLRIMVTSREPLGLGGEQEFPVLPLEEEAATELFLKRARLVEPTFELTPANAGDVAEICAHLDRLPLAVELAAARVKLLTPHQLLDRLSRCRGVESHRHDVPERHRTMRSTVQWSYDLLRDDERRVFARLAVFAGGFTLDAAEEICGRDLKSDPQAVLESLLNKSLIRQRDDGSMAPRFSMLETVREFASERLEAEPEVADVRDHHALLYCVAAEELGSSSLERRGERLRQLGTEYENVRAALEWSASGGDAEVGHRIVGSLAWFWTRSNLFSEGVEWAERFLGLEGHAEEGVLGRTYLVGGRMQFYLGNEALSREMLLVAEDHARAAGDRETEAWALSWSCADEMSHAEHHDAIEERLRRAIRIFEELDLTHGQLSVNNNFGELLRARGRYEAAIVAYTAAITITEGSGFPHDGIVLANIGSCQWRLGRFSDATDSFRKSLRLVLEHELGDYSVAGALEGLASVAEDPADAARLMGAADSIREAVGGGSEPADRACHDAVIAHIQSRLEQTDYDRHRAEGSALSIEEAVRLALGESLR
ncbi:MAG: tetratricopeptide repeat protein [Spirochaetales bacterium]|nr:tetratricopeptide repeat protein [Spirochaetales bacterium]